MIAYLRHINRRKSIPIWRDIIQKKFKITDNNKLTGPALLNSSGFGNFDIAFIRSTNASRRINTQRPFSWKQIEMLILYINLNIENFQWTLTFINLRLTLIDNATKLIIVSTVSLPVKTVSRRVNFQCFVPQTGSIFNVTVQRHHHWLSSELKTVKS